jgi:hypothetical protein
LKRMTASDKRAVLNYVERRPTQIPVVSPVVARVYPERGGQLESNQYDLEQSVKMLPTYMTKDMTPEQMRTVDTKFWTAKKVSDAKIVEKYDLSMINESNAAREAYRKANPEIDATLALWNHTASIVSVAGAQALTDAADKFGIPIGSIPAFAKRANGTERIPVDKNLWKAYFDYNDLPGSSYLAMSQDQVDAGELPAKYLTEWTTYQKLKTDVARTAYRNAHKEAAKSTWRDDLRKANPAFDKWLQTNGNDGNGMKPLAAVKKKAATTGGATLASMRGGASSGGFSSSGGFGSLGGSSGRSSMPAMPKRRAFPKVRGIGAPRAPSV